jgi:hypothetical protein
LIATSTSEVPMKASVERRRSQARRIGFSQVYYMSHTPRGGWVKPVHLPPPKSPFIHAKPTFADIGLLPPQPRGEALNREHHKLRSSRAGAEPLQRPLPNGAYAHPPFGTPQPVTREERGSTWGGEKARPGLE